MVWQIINSDKLPGKENMNFDRKLFSDFEKGLIGPTFRIYGWSKPCISIGYSQKSNDVPQTNGCEIVKRPTGGGICYHTADEISYSVVSSKDDPIVGGTLMESYFRISEIILKALRSLGLNPTLNMSAPVPNLSGLSFICFSQTRDYEITLNGKKIVGSAQRRGRVGFLQQGTILTDLIGIDRDKIINSLLNGFSPKRQSGDIVFFPV